jgi:hypothetical protein
MHGLYEQVRITSDINIIDKLTQEMFKLSDGLGVPNNIESLKSFVKGQ